MMKKIITNESEAMQRLLKILGMNDMAVISFELKVAVKKNPIITATFYAPDTEHLPENIVTQEFELKAIK